MISNFEFLALWNPKSAELARKAEENLAINDPNTCLLKIGQIVEFLITALCELSRMDGSSRQRSIRKCILDMYLTGVIPSNIKAILTRIWEIRNKANHSGYDNPVQAAFTLNLLFDFCVWFVKTVYDPMFVAKDFVSPKSSLKRFNCHKDMVIHDYDSRFRKGRSEGNRKRLTWAR